MTHESFLEQRANSTGSKVACWVFFMSPLTPHWFLKSDAPKETIVFENQEPLEMRKERWEWGYLELSCDGLSAALRRLMVSCFSQRRHGSEEDPPAGAQAQE